MAGKKTVTAGDIMTSPVVAIKKDALLTEAIDLLLRWNISALPVVDDSNRLVGLLGEHDLMNFVFSGNAADTTVGEVMVRDVVTYPPDTAIETLVNCCASRRIRMVPITAKGKVVGVVSRRDILRQMREMYGRY